MSVWSAIGQLGASAIQALSQQQPSSTTHQAKLQDKYGRKYAEWSAKNLPTLNRQGMEDAGFNPILAVTQGTGTAGNIGLSGSGAYDASGGAGSSLAQAFKEFGEIEHFNNEIERQKAEIANINAGTAKTLQETKIPRHTVLQFLERLGRKALKTYKEIHGHNPRVEIYNQIMNQNKNNSSSAAGVFGGSHNPLGFGGSQSSYNVRGMYSPDGTYSNFQNFLLPGEY